MLHRVPRWIAATLCVLSANCGSGGGNGDGGDVAGTSELPGLQPANPSDAWIDLGLNDKISRIAFDPAGRLFAIAWKGIWRATPPYYGDWTNLRPIPDGSYRYEGLGISPSGAVFVGTFKNGGGAQIFRSTDNGATWLDKSAGLASNLLYAYCFAFHPSGDILVGTGWSKGASSIYRSKNLGESWAPASAALEVEGTIALGLGVSPDGSYALAGTETYGVYRWDSGSDTWTPDFLLQQGSAAPQYPRIKTSTGTVVENPNYPTGLHATALTCADVFNFAFTGSAVFTGRTNGPCPGSVAGIYRSVDQGKSWELKKPALRVWKVIVNGSGQIFGVDSGDLNAPTVPSHIWVSSDVAGSSWSELALTGLPSEVVSGQTVTPAQLLSIAFGPDGHLYCAGRKGVSRSVAKLF